MAPGGVLKNNLSTRDCYFSRPSEKDPAGFRASKVVRRFFLKTVRLGARVRRARVRNKLCRAGGFVRCARATYMINNTIVLPTRYKQAGLQLFFPLFLKSGSQTAARGTRLPKRTVLKKHFLATLEAINPWINPVGSFSNVIRT